MRNAYVYLRLLLSYKKTTNWIGLQIYFQYSLTCIYIRTIQQTIQKLSSTSVLKHFNKTPTSKQFVLQLLKLVVQDKIRKLTPSISIKLSKNTTENATAFETLNHQEKSKIHNKWMCRRVQTVLCLNTTALQWRTGPSCLINRQKYR